MKDLGTTKKILGVKLIKDRKKGILSLTWQKYNRKVLERFKMGNSKTLQTLLSTHFKLSCQQCPKTDDEKAEIALLPYSSVVGCLMYVMVLTRPNFSHAVSVVNKYMSNPEKEYWKVV